MYLPEYDPEHGGPRNKLEAWIDALIHKINVFIGTHCVCGWEVPPGSTKKKCPNPKCDRYNGF